MNRAQAARIRGLLAARYPDGQVEVTAESDGARICIEHADGHIRATVGEEPGMVLRVLLGRDLRVVDGGPGA